MSTPANKARVVVGATASRTAERTLLEGTTVRLDGTLAAATREILRLHNQIETVHGEAYREAQRMYRSVFKPSVPKIVRVGELLTRVRESPAFKGKWLIWLKHNMPFDQKTAWRYMKVYQNRDKLGNDDASVPNFPVTEVYARLLPPPKWRRKCATTVARLSEKTNGTDNEPVTGTEPESIESGSESQPRRRPKSGRQIEKELQRISENQREAEIKVNAQLAEIITGLSRKVRTAWLEFPDHLAAHSKALSALADRLRLNTPRL